MKTTIEISDCAYIFSSADEEEDVDLKKQEKAEGKFQIDPKIFEKLICK